MSVVDEAVQSLEEYAAALGAIEANRLKSKINSIRKQIQGLRNLGEYIVKLEQGAGAVKSKKEKKSDKQIVLEYSVILEKLRQGKPLTPDETRQAMELKTGYPRLAALVDGRSSAEEMIEAQNLSQWTAVELRLLYCYVFHDYYSGTKKDLLADLDQYKSRLKYYHALEQK
jgi:predicted transcriptional regulator